MTVQDQAREMATFIRERWNPANTMPPNGIADLLDRLADRIDALLTEHSACEEENVNLRNEVRMLRGEPRLPATEPAQAEEERRG